YLKNVTHAEIHTYENGQAETYRVDHGKIESVGDNSITITERDGSEVTIPTDDATKVIGGPHRKLSRNDLKSGVRVMVDREGGDPAKTIGRGPKQAQQLPPPPPAPGQGYGPPGGAS